MGYIILLMIAGALLYHMCQNSMQAAMSFVIGVDFAGEYRQGDSDWKPLDADTRLSAFDGDVILRGQFTEPLPGVISYYMNHIGVTITINGEEVSCSGRVSDEVPPEMCGTYWNSCLYEKETPVEEIEIRLHNPQIGRASCRERV